MDLIAQSISFGTSSTNMLFRLKDPALARKRICEGNGECLAYGRWQVIPNQKPFSIVINAPTKVLNGRPVERKKGEPIPLPNKGKELFIPNHLEVSICRWRSKKSKLSQVENVFYLEPETLDAQDQFIRSQFKPKAIEPSVSVLPLRSFFPDLANVLPMNLTKRDEKRIQKLLTLMTYWCIKATHVEGF